MDTVVSPVQNNQPAQLLVGIDVGSTTAKIAVMDASTHEVLMRRYVRHHAQQANCLKGLLEELHQQFGSTPMRAALCGSGGAALAEALGLPYVQEVVANSLAVSANYPTARTAIELGGQDAKMIFFAYDEKASRLSVADMRMNGSCAGGTGAFIDEIATLLKVPTEQFNDLAQQGKAVHNVSGRCGVYAKPTSSLCSTRACRNLTLPFRPSMPLPSKPSAAWRKALKSKHR